MRPIPLLARSALYFALSTCIAPASSTQMSWTPTASTSEPSSAHGNQNLSAACGEARVTIQCSPASANCTQTTLRLHKADGSAIELAKPQGTSRYTAVGLACTQAKDGMRYLVVQYGERPRGCEFCEWFHLYTARGELLTHSDPAILIDNTLPKGKDQIPNNREFEALVKKLRIEIPDIDLLK